MARNDRNPVALPGYYIGLIARGMTRIGDARLRDLGFAAAQIPVLSALKDGSKLSQADLARRAKVEQPTMAQLLARMERDGIVQRAPDPDDGRASLISLTEAAFAKLPSGRAIIAQSNREATRGLSAADVEMLVGLLERILANVDTMDK